LRLTAGINLLQFSHLSAKSAADGQEGKLTSQGCYEPFRSLLWPV